jgi:uncharacterized protein with GYD domain
METQSRIPEQTRAYVLIHTELGKTQEAVAALRQLPGARMVNIVAGPYDIVAVIEAPNPTALGEMVLSTIHSLPGIKDTLTLIAVA